MKNQAFFSSKDKSKKLKCRLLQFLFGNLRARKADNIIYICKISEIFHLSYITARIILSGCATSSDSTPELLIRGDIEGNSRISYLISQ